MTQSAPPPENKTKPKTPLSVWPSIVLAIVLAFGLVGLFGLIVFLFARGAQQMGLSTPAYIVILVVVSGVFAWALKRLTDIAAGMSRLWFPEDSDDEN
ncbi:MAG: hypothetical protein HC875_28550 [Anaerolineales bacterium]|nr:hypothetical protein [Anaerolineales bacterium]